MGTPAPSLQRGPALRHLGVDSGLQSRQRVSIPVTVICSSGPRKLIEAARRTARRATDLPIMSS